MTQKPTKTQLLLYSAGMARSTRRPALALAVGLSMLGLMGCVSQGDFLRLQERVAEMDSGARDEPDPFARIAQLSAKLSEVQRSGAVPPPVEPVKPRGAPPPSEPPVVEPTEPDPEPEGDGVPEDARPSRSAGWGASPRGVTARASQSPAGGAPSCPSSSAKVRSSSAWSRARPASRSRISSAVVSPRGRWWGRLSP